MSLSIGKQLIVKINKKRRCVTLMFEVYFGKVLQEIFNFRNFYYLIVVSIVFFMKTMDGLIMNKKIISTLIILVILTASLSSV
ncbi:MAG: hypothetical protein C0594_11820, partial [Marinilabiliales bacterium]